jgi:hypothetical protein
MLISLIHPSRGRAAKSWSTTREWIDRAGCDTELIVSIDASDPQKEAYQVQYTGKQHTKLLVNDNDCVVQAANHAAAASSGSILLYLSDDFKSPISWGKDIIDLTSHLKDKWLLKVDDCLQRFEADVLTIPIMSRSLYENLGYFFHPGYKSMFTDQDLFWTCQNMGVIVNARHMKFPHEHYCNGKAKKDATYERSDLNWNSGKEFYNQRKRQGFPVDC